MNVKSYPCSDITKSRHNNPLLPRSIRGLIVGKSSCGKTTLMLNLLQQPGWLDYNNLQVFGPGLMNQSEYQILKKGYEEKLLKEEIDWVLDNTDKIWRINATPELLWKKCQKTIR